MTMREALVSHATACRTAAVQPCWWRYVEPVFPEWGHSLDFRGLDLRGLDLRYLQLPPGADFRGADLSGADLTHASLRKAQLQGAICSRATFQYADLRGARLRETDFQEADLSCARLQQSIWSKTNFRGAMLIGIEYKRRVKDSRYTIWWYARGDQDGDHWLTFLVGDEAHLYYRNKVAPLVQWVKEERLTADEAAVIEKSKDLLRDRMHVDDGSFRHRDRV